MHSQVAPPIILSCCYVSECWLYSAFGVVYLVIGIIPSQDAAVSIDHVRLHNFKMKRVCCHFAQVIGITSDPKTTFPFLLKTRAST